MIKTPIESFLELTRKSGLVEANRLNLYLERLAQKEGIPQDPKGLVNLFVRDAVLSRFQADQLLAGKWRGFYVGKYRVIERIGIGGMGQVYLAEHRTMKRRYAIKVLPRSKAADPAALERFEREARAGGSIDHPNIVRAYDKDQDGDLHYLVMDFVDGCSLAEIVKASGVLSYQRVANYLYQSAQGLKHAYDAGLIHRDIKPANILVDRTGTVKILDMGLARFFNDEEDMITKKYDETVLGTADYLSPEQAIDSHNVDIRTDIYSLGCSYYYTLTGQPPFGEGSIAQKLIWHQTRAPRAIKEFRADIPDHLNQVLIKCMHKKPDERFANPNELIAELSRYANFCYPPTPEELPELSAMARGVPFGGDILSGIATQDEPSPIVSRDPESRPSQIFDSQASKRVAGSDDSTVHISSGDSSVEHKSLKPVPATPTQPTMPMMVNIAKGPGIAPRKHSDPPLVPPMADPESPVPPISPITWEPYPMATRPRRGSSASAGVLEVLPATEAPTISTIRRNRRETLKAVPPWVWLAVGIAIVVTVLIFAWVVIFRGKPTTGTTNLKNPASGSLIRNISTEVKPASGPRIWHVAKNKLDGIDCTSIQDALRQASPGDTILITDRQVYEEALTLTPRTSPRGFGNITIKAEIGDDGKRAKLTPPSGHPVTRPLLSIENVEQLTITGLLFDGDQGVQNVIELRGRCADVTLEDLRIEGFQRSGVVVDNLHGTGRREVKLNKLWVRPRNENNFLATAAVQVTGPVCEGLRITGCRFQGPFDAAVLLAAPTQRFLMEQCKLHNGKHRALVWGEAIPPYSRHNVIVQHNTFWDFETGLAVESAMKKDDVMLVVRNNLFFQVKSLLQINETKAKIKPEGLAGGLQGGGNIYDQQTSGPGQAGQVAKFGMKALTFSLNTSLNPHKEFLRYPAGSPLAAAGELNQPVGATE
jgi:serine/threonine protein kinase